MILQYAHHIRDLVKKNGGFTPRSLRLKLNHLFEWNGVYKIILFETEFEI